MSHPRLVDVVRRSVAAAKDPEPAYAGREGKVPVGHYMDPAHLVKERPLFRRLPIPIAHTSEFPVKGITLVRELDGVSLLLVRGDDGVIRAFRNACRHRAARLVREDCRQKAFTCPYHGWTYGLDGALRHVPHQGAFPMLDTGTSGLAAAKIEERHGIVWASLEDDAPDVKTHLGELDEELTALGLGHHFVARRAVSEQRGNWKMLMEAFLDGYHIRTLHRDTVYPFFLDARSVAERSGPHVRAATARRLAKTVTDEAAFASRSLRDLATPSYSIFPCTTLVLHPDWTSLVVVLPLAPDRFAWMHAQLLASEPETDEARDHFARSFDLIEGSVFQNEDLAIIAETQAGLETGANDALTFGRLESPALWFHDAIAEELER